MTTLAYKPQSYRKQLLTVLAALLAGGVAGAFAFGIASGIGSVFSASTSSVSSSISSTLDDLILSFILTVFFTVPAALIFGLPAYFFLKWLKILNIYSTCLGGIAASIAVPMILFPNFPSRLSDIMSCVVVGLFAALTTFFVGKHFGLRTSMEEAKK